MRRIAAVVLLAVIVLAACGDDDDAAVDDGIVDRNRRLPADVRAFLDRVEDPATVAFSATYELLNKNGGATHSIDVSSTGSVLSVTIDGAKVDPEDDVALSAYGIFAGFLAANPMASIEAAARRADAGDAELSTKTIAGVTLDCISIPVQGAPAFVDCLTPDGIFGYVDNPSVRYELTRYDVSRS